MNDLPFDENSQLEYLWKIYNSIQDWIKFSDAKSGAIIGANGGVIGIVIGNSKHINNLVTNHGLFFWCLVIGGFMVTFSTILAILCILPTLSVGEPNSIIYYAHIAKKTKNAKEYRDRFDGILRESVLKHQLQDQIWANALVCWKKYKYTYYSLICFIVLFVTIAIALLFSFILE